MIEPRPGVNAFFGGNGSGKTSLLEAIYFLGN
ncbi:MAG: AAA family ATPase, partial [Cycloclasticus pugetii]